MPRLQQKASPKPMLMVISSSMALPAGAEAYGAHHTIGPIGNEI